MRIALLTPQLSQGGAEKMVYHLAAGLKRLGDEVVVFSSGGYYWEKLLENGIDAPLFPLNNPRVWLNPEFRRSLAFALNKGQYDVLHVQTIPLAFLVRWLTRRYGLKAQTLLTLHGSPEWKITWSRPFLQRLRVKRCAVSGRLANQIQGVYIPNAVDIPHISGFQMTANDPLAMQREIVSSRVGFKGKRQKSFVLRVLIVARLVPEKGIDLWLKAVKQLADEGIIVETWLAGDGPEREKLRKFGEEHHLRICFLGWVENPWQFRKEVDLFVLPSRREGEPLALLEAMAVSLPILASHVGGIPTLLKDQRGILVPPTPDGLAKGVKAFLALSPSEYQERLQRAYAFVRLRTWESCVHSYREQYQALTRKGTNAHFVMNEP